MPDGSRRRGMIAVLAGLVLALTAAPGVAATPAAPVVDSITANASPEISLDGAPITLTGTITGRDLPAAGLRVVVRRAATSLPDRAAVAAWAEGTEPATGEVLASGRATRTPDGASFRVRVRMTGLSAERPYGSIPISIEAGGRSIRSFLPFQQRKEYEPLRVAVTVPIVGTTTAGKYGTPEERLAAWSAEAAPDGRLGRILGATAGLEVGYLIDPALLDAGSVPDEGTTTTTTSTTSTTTPSTTPTTTAPATSEADPGSSYAASAEEVTVRAGLADRIRATTTGRPLLLLPPSDPDVAAAAAGPGARALVAARVADADAGPVLWPAQGSWSTAIEAVVDALDPRHTGVALADSGALRSQGGSSTEAMHRTRGGTRLLVADRALSARLAAVTDGGGVQAFLADTLALLAERPGTTRTFLIALPRELDANPALVAALRALASAPWIDTVAIDALATEPVGPTLRPVGARPAGPTSPIPAGATALARAVRELTTTASVRADRDAYVARWTETAEALTSTGWRGDAPAWGRLAGAVRAEGKRATTGLGVPAREINFLADSGRLRIVVTNALDVPVRGLRLRLVPESPRLRIDSSPIELAIGADSRTTVTVAATALAAGEVPVRAELLTPTGQVISSSTNIRIRVTPTGAEVYWILGGLAGLVLVLGFLRSRRRHRAAAAVTAGTLPA